MQFDLDVVAVIRLVVSIVPWCVFWCTYILGAVSVKATAFLNGSEEVDVGDEMVREGLAVYLSETARPHTPDSLHSEPSEDDGNSSTEAPIPAVGPKVLCPRL